MSQHTEYPCGPVVTGAAITKPSYREGWATFVVPAVTPSCGAEGLPAGLGGNGGALSTELVAEGVFGGSTPLPPSRLPPVAQEGRIQRLTRSPCGNTGAAAVAAAGSSFANVYLNELDQFVKHTLKAKRYARYVDDFVLIHHDRAQLAAWLPQIGQFLQDRLRLTLKADIRLKPLTAGLDFLGYWIYPTHTLVRPRVIHHARQKLDAWQQRHVRRTANGWRINAGPQQQDRLRSVWASYQGHFRHADSLRLQQAFSRRYGWLMQLAPTVFPETLTSSTARNSP